MTDRVEGLEQTIGSGLDPGLVAVADASASGKLKAGGGGLSLGAASWSLYEGARDPYVIVIVIYIFNPYFATAVVGDPVKGQVLLANIAIIYGLLAAATGPFLGASIDRIGRRKPLLLTVTALMAPMLFALWWIKPLGAGGLGVGIGSLLLGLLGGALAYTEILHNSMLTRAATPRQAPLASGLAMSLGNLFSVFMLVFVLWAFALPGKVHWPFIPAHPLFGLNPLKHETDRIVGPLVGAFMALAALPIFFFTPDAPATGVGVFKALSQGWDGLKATLRTLKGQTAAAIFLVSRMLYTDGMSTMLIFTGVYAAGVRGWGTLELLAYGVLLSTFSVLGGQMGALWDARLGPRRAVQIEILGSAVCLLAQLGMGPNKILFMPFNAAAHAPIWRGPIFHTLPELMYLAVGCGNAVFVCAQYASSRTFLSRLAPPGQSASFFGLYALSGTATLWLGSALVRIFTGAFKTQQAGFAPIFLLLVLGFIGMLFVKHDGREAAPGLSGDAV